MTELADFVTKRRCLCRPAALRLLREQAWTRYARRAIPSSVDGVRIELPQTLTSLTHTITIASERLSGESLFSMLYQEQTQHAALKMGLVALKALQRADVVSAPFSPFSEVYDLVRGAKFVLNEMTDPILSSTQRRSFLQLLRHYVVQPDRHTLVHGDLQASHVIVDVSRQSIGFIDFEAMRIGRAVTNFAQLWQAYQYADPCLGRSFYQRYVADCPEPRDAQFDADARAELALRCYSHIRSARRLRNHVMAAKATELLAGVLSGRRLEQISLEGDCRERTKDVQ